MKKERIGEEEKMEGKGEGGRSRSSLLPWKPKGRMY
jgi:hypothetical protein